MRSVTVSRNMGFNPFIGLTDFVAGASRVSLWMVFASDEIKQRYRRSKLGLAWIVVSYLIFIGAIALFFGGFSALESSSFTAYVAVNFAIFNFTVANITDGCTVFRSAKTWISSTPLPHSIHVLKSISRSLFIFTINVLTAIIVILSAGQKVGYSALCAIPALIVILFNGVLVQVVFGYVAARFRDIEHLMQSITRILFFTTPIVWVRDELNPGGLRDTVANWNPFTHALEIFAMPILGEPVDLDSWIFMGWFTLAMFVLALLVSAYSHRRLPYWL